MIAVGRVRRGQVRYVPAPRSLSEGAPLMPAPGDRSRRMRQRPLGVGLIVPQWEGHLDGQTPRWGDALTVARAAEAVGFDTLWIIDDLLIDVDGTRFGVWECWSWTAALAAATQHIALGTYVC